MRYKDMREINSEKVADIVANMCIMANCHINPDIKNALIKSRETEESAVSRAVLVNLIENSARTQVWQCSLSR